MIDSLISIQGNKLLNDVVLRHSSKWGILLPNEPAVSINIDNQYSE